MLDSRRQTVSYRGEAEVGGREQNLAGQQETDDGVAAVVVVALSLGAPSIFPSSVFHVVLRAALVACITVSYMYIWYIVPYALISFDIES